MKILVTGGAGYVGLQTVRELAGHGHYCVIYDNLSTGNRDLIRAETLVVGDLLDSRALDAVFQQTHFDAVAHFAGASLVGESVEKPLHYYEQNVAATLHLLAAMRDHNVSRIIFSSTAAVYGEAGAVPLHEDTPCRPINPYGRSKHMVEQILEDCFQREWLQYISLRYFNAAGADPEAGLGERRRGESHLIPTLLQEIKRAQHEKRRPVAKVFGKHYGTADGTCVRDFIHVKDLASAHVAALRALTEKQHSSRIFNVGAGTGSSVLEVVQMAAAVTGADLDIQIQPPRPGDPPTLVAQTSRIREELGFAPRHSDLKTILASSWAWEKRG